MKMNRVVPQTKKRELHDITLVQRVGLLDV